MSRETAINPAELKETEHLGYSHVIEKNGVVYMSGQIAMNSDNEIVGDDTETQTRKVFENIGTVLDAVGKGFEDVMYVKTYLLDCDEQFDDYIAVHKEFFDEPYPCNTVIQVEQLRLPEYLLEVEVEVPIEHPEATGGA